MSTIDESKLNLKSSKYGVIESLTRYYIFSSSSEVSVIISYFPFPSSATSFIRFLETPFPTPIE